MLAYQQAYLNYVEEQRHNLNVEQEAWRHNRMSELLEKRNQDITAYKTAADIMLRSKDLAQQKWANEKTAEINRINARTNQFKASTERLQAQMNYTLGQQNLAVAQTNADTARANARLGFYSLQNQERQTAISQQNADTNWYTAQQNAYLTQQRISNERQLGWANLQQTQVRDFNSATANYMNAASRLLTSVSQAYKNFT